MNTAFVHKKILVIDLAFIGDVILATPVLRSLKENYPDAAITMLTVPLTAEIARLNPYVDSVIPYDKKAAHKGVCGMLKIASILRREKFDMAVCMNFALRGAVVAWLARIPVRVGYDAQHAGFFLTHVASSVRPEIQHERLNHLQVLTALKVAPSADTSLEVEVPLAAAQSMQEKVGLGSARKPTLAICPYGSYWKKNLPEDTLRELIRDFQADYDVYLVGDKKAAGRFAQLAVDTGLPARNLLAGTLSLTELAAFLQQVDCLLTVDTGPQHLAQAAGCPVVALFGPTDPRVWGPVAQEDITLYHACACSPCWGKGDCAQNTCMLSLEKASIVQAVKERMDKGRD